MEASKHMGKCSRCNQPMVLNDVCVGRLDFSGRQFVSTGPVWRQVDRPASTWEGTPTQERVWHIDCKAPRRIFRTPRDVEREIAYIALINDHVVKENRLNELRELYRYNRGLFTSKIVSDLKDLVERQKNPPLGVHYFFQE